MAKNKIFQKPEKTLSILPKSKLSFAVKYLLIILISFFLIRKLLTSWDQVITHSFEINYLLFTLSLFLLFFNFLLAYSGWRHILKKLGEGLHKKRGFFLFLKSQISRYVPGVIWPYIGRVYLTKKEGASGTKVFISLLLETFFIIITSSIVSFLFLFMHIKEITTGNLYWYLLIGSIVFLILLPRILHYSVKIGTKLLKRKEISVGLKYSDILSIFFIYSLRWLLLGAAFTVFTISIFPLDVSTWPLLFGTSVFSWLIGFLFFMVPGGIGVKETAITLLLQQVMPAGIAVLIALASRIWLIIGETLAFYASYLISKS